MLSRYATSDRRLPRPTPATDPVDVVKLFVKCHRTGIIVLSKDHLVASNLRHVMTRQRVLTL